MPLDPAMLKIRWGVTDPALDPLVDAAAEQAQALCEEYTGRRFDFGPDVADFSPANFSFQVRRFPIKSVDALWQWDGASVNPPAEPVPGAGVGVAGLDKAAGLVFVRGWPAGRMVHCEWQGGYDDWPPALAWAVTEAADIVWSGTPGGGAPAGTPGGSMGALKRISVPGVYSAEVGGDSAGSGDGDNTWGILPPGITAILDRYSLAAVVGIG